MDFLAIVIWGLCGFLAAGLAVAYLGLFGLLLFRFLPLPALKREKLPGVTVIKSCYANADNEIENLDTFFHQDYPGPVELLFAVTNETDPIVPVIKQYLAKYPKADARLVLSTTRTAYWNKLNALHDAQDQAKHEVIIWSDSDVVVRPQYLSQMVACLQEPGVSLVTTPQYDFRANNLATGFKVPANNCDDATFMMAYNLVVRRKKVALGHSMGFWAAEFNSLGAEAWDTLNRFIADDLGLPYLYEKHGKKVVFRNVYCPVEYANKTWKQVIDQKRRWVMCQKQAVGNRALYFFSAFFYPEVPALYLMLLTGFESWTVWAFAAACFTRIGISALFESLFLGSLRMTLRYGWLVPVWDLAQIAFVMDGFFRETITLGGREFRLDKQFFLSPVKARS